LYSPIHYICENLLFMSSRPVRVRFAPSPTGPLHMGGVRTALFNYLFAKKHNGKFILRIEDTDQFRFVPGAEEYIIKSLNWSGLQYDEGPDVGGQFAPYKQSERKDIYWKYADKLISEGHAYYAFDTTEELDGRRKEYESKKRTFSYNQSERTHLKNSLTLSEDKTLQLLTDKVPYVIRLKIPEDEEIIMHDIIRGEVRVNSSSLDDKVIFKADGLPTYHLANVVDDYLMQISHVIRGEEWLPSLPLHVLLYRYLGWEKSMPEFAHLPLILKPNGQGKLSKRDGDKLGFPVFPLLWKDPDNGEISKGYKDSGYFVEAFVNMIAFLGWNPGTEQELFNLSQLVEAFTLERVGKSGARFDPDKTKWFNQQYLKTKSDAELTELFTNDLKEKGITKPVSFVEKTVHLLKDRAVFVKDFWDQGKYFFIPPDDYDQDVIKKRWSPEMPVLLSELVVRFKALPEFTSETIKSEVHAFAEAKGANFGNLMNCLRLCLVGSSMGPDLATLCEMLGAVEITYRIEKAIREIK
jgi:glutamyl-tRNA synthetase